MYTAIQSVVFCRNYDASISGMLAACANLGSILAARAPTRAASWLSGWLSLQPRAILRGLWLEAILIRSAGGWRNSLSYSLIEHEPGQPIAQIPFRVIVLPD